ncbi:unnamed protein product [Soboliphyme baturini]|uniref:COMMD10 n=1 Tax=Soboliphyme baturini TaxID=241478 RepID=A0A183JAU5_9BILA|nr:unnamed protein product [Soboliphyme baturini]
MITSEKAFVVVAQKANGMDVQQFSELIENKLMAGDDLWSSEHLVSSLSKNFLAYLCSLFVDMQTQTKLKLLLSFLHLSKRNLEQVS